MKLIHHFRLAAKILIIYFLLFLPGIRHGWAQKIKASELPPQVSSSFSNQFPKARKAEWEKTETGYTVDFLIEKKVATASLYPDGKLYSAEIEISRSSLPFEVAERIENEFPEYEIRKVILSESVLEGKRYRLHLKKDKELKSVLFKANGTRL